MKRSVQWSLAAGLAFGLTACGDESGEVPTTSQLQSEIFTPQCATSGCHAGSAPSAGLDLTPPVRDKLVGVPSSQVTRNLVEAGDPGLSYLYDKVLGTMISTTGSMPPGSPLSDEEIDMIREWIEAGAPEF